MEWQEWCATSPAARALASMQGSLQGACIHAGLLPRLMHSPPSHAWLQMPMCAVCTHGELMGEGCSAHQPLLIPAPAYSQANHHQAGVGSKQGALCQVTPDELIPWETQLAAAACGSTTSSQPPTAERCQVILETR